MQRFGAIVDARVPRSRPIVRAAVQRLDSSGSARAAHAAKPLDHTTDPRDDRVGELRSGASEFPPLDGTLPSDNLGKREIDTAPMTAAQTVPDADPTRNLLPVQAVRTGLRRSPRPTEGGRRQCRSPDRSLVQQRTAKRAQRSGRCAEQPDLRVRPAQLQPLHHRVRHLVLFRAATGVQPHGRPPAPHPPLAAAVRAGDDGASTRWGPA
jgi:hypothetical protein